MRVTARSVGNGIAWVGIFALIAAGLYIVHGLGFPGVLLLGIFTTLICVRAELSEDMPTSGVGVFTASLAGTSSPEERAASQEARDRGRSSLRYYRRCGLALVAIGLLGILWQVWN